MSLLLLAFTFIPYVFNVYLIILQNSGIPRPIRVPGDLGPQLLLVHLHEYWVIGLLLEFFQQSLQVDLTRELIAVVQHQFFLVLIQPVDGFKADSFVK